MSSLNSCLAKRMTSLRKSSCSSLQAESKVRSLSLSRYVRPLLSLGGSFGLRLRLRASVRRCSLFFSVGSGCGGGLSVLWLHRLPLEALGAAAGNSDARRDSQHGHVVWHIGQNQAVGGDHDVINNLRSTHNLRDGADVYVVANDTSTRRNHHADMDSQMSH